MKKVKGIILLIVMGMLLTACGAKRDQTERIEETEETVSSFADKETVTQTLSAINQEETQHIEKEDLPIIELEEVTLEKSDKEGLTEPPTKTATETSTKMPSQEKIEATTKEQAATSEEGSTEVLGNKPIELPFVPAK